MNLIWLKKKKKKNSVGVLIKAQPKSFDESRLCNTTQEIERK